MMEVKIFLVSFSMSKMEMAFEHVKNEGHFFLIFSALLTYHDPLSVYSTKFGNNVNCCLIVLQLYPKCFFFHFHFGVDIYFQAIVNLLEN